MLEDAITFLAALIGGAIAAVAGFGIGSLITPVFAVSMGAKLAVAAVSVPHMIGTAYRLAMLRKHIDWAVLRSFGLMSAAGGLAGALLHTSLRSIVLALVFGVLLVFVGLAGLSGLAARLRFEGPAAWIAGLVSGLLGGLVGNQGGIRSGAMLGLGVPKEAFVATATATGLLVDFARLPVYVATLGPEMLEQWRPIAVAVVGTLAGTALGRPVLARLPERVFRNVVSGLVLALGLWMLASAAGLFE